MTRPTLKNLLNDVTFSGNFISAWIHLAEKYIKICMKHLCLTSPDKND